MNISYVLTTVTVVLFIIQILMNARPIRVTMEGHVTISSMVTDVSVLMVILENNVEPVSRKLKPIFLV